MSEAFGPAMVGQLYKELINFVTLNVTFRVKIQGGSTPIFSPILCLIFLSKNISINKKCL